MHWLDLTILVVLALGAVLGFWSGLLWQVARVVSLLLSLYLAIVANPQATDWLTQEWKDVSAAVCRIIAFVAVFLLAYVVMYLITRMLHKAIKSTKLELADRLLGGLMGMAKMGSILCVACAGLDALDLPVTHDWLKESTLAPHFTKGMDAAIALVPPELRERVDENFQQARDQLQKKVADAALQAVKKEIDN